MMARLNSGPRSDESPMDFKWDNHQGPVEKNSPFINGTALGVKYNTFAGQKRSANDLGSPTRKASSALKSPDPKTYLFSASKPLNRNPSFTTPQRSIGTELSSGPDVSSPANADAEDTPERPMGSVLREFSGATIQSANRERGSKVPFGGSFSNHTGKGVIPRKGHNVTLSRRVEKRRRREADKDVRSAPRRSSNSSDSDEQSSDSVRTEKKAPAVQDMGFVPSVFTFIDAHPSLPNTLSFYVQFLLNCFFAFCMMYVFYGIYSTIINDINERAMVESSAIFAEMAACAHEFKENRCDRNTRVPAMESVCNNWEKCMQRDPLKVGRSKLTAGMLAEIFNGFIEPISLKAIIVSITVIVGCFAVNNLTFGLWRAKTQHSPRPQHAPFAHAPQQPMNWRLPNQQYFTPYQNHMGMSRIDPGQSGYIAEGDSPTKRLGYW